jgi:hypothetical protein
MLSLLALIAMSFHVTLLPLIVVNDKAQALAAAVIFSLPFAVMYMTEKYLVRVFRN